MIFNKVSGNVNRKELYEKTVELVKQELKKCKDEKVLRSISFEAVDPQFLLNEYDTTAIIYYEAYKCFENLREIRHSEEVINYTMFFYDLGKKINSKVEKITNGQYHCFESGDWDDGYLFLSTDTEDR